MQDSERDTRDILLYTMIAIVVLALCSLPWILPDEGIVALISTPQPIADATIETPTPKENFNPPIESPIAETSPLPMTSEEDLVVESRPEEPEEEPTIEAVPEKPEEELIVETVSEEPEEEPTPEPLTGVVSAFALNIREAPTDASRIVGAARHGDEVRILNQARAGYWLEVVTEGGRRGWVLASWIEGVDSDEVPLAFVDISQYENGTSPVPIVKVIDIEPGTLVDERTVSGSIREFDDEWFVFTENNIETVIVFMYRPNIQGIQFQLFRDELIPDDGLPSGNPEDMDNVGAGSFPYEDRDGDPNTGELLWRGGDLIVGSRYYIWFSNPTGQPIDYCIIPGDVYEWICDP